MFKVKSKHSMPICIYQFLLWHLSCISQRDGCRTGDGPAVHGKKHSSAWISVWPRAQGDAAASANAALVGEGTTVFPNGAPFQRGSDWIPCPQFGSPARFFSQWIASWYRLPVCGIHKAAGSAKARCCWYTHGGSTGRCMVYSSHTWYPVVLLSCKRWSCAQSAALAQEKTESLLQLSFCDLCLKICHALVS